MKPLLEFIQKVRTPITREQITDDVHNELSTVQIEHTYDLLNVILIVMWG